MEILDCNLDFLDNIEIDSVSKSLRFNEKEAYMIKFPIYLKKPFGTYVKELINNDIKQYCARNQKTASETHVDKESLKDLITEILKENYSMLLDRTSESDIKPIEEELAVEEYEDNDDATSIVLDMLRG